MAKVLDSSGNIKTVQTTSVATVNEIGDATITSPADNEVLAYDSGSALWINQTLDEAGITHDALTDFVANEHIDWTSTSSNFSTSGTVGGGVATFTTINGSGNVTIYEATNDGNPEVRLGATDAEELHIQSVYDSGAQTLDYALFQTDAASATANKGLFRFNVDGTDIADINDGGINLKSGSFTFAINGSSVLAATNLGSGIVSSSLTSVGTLAGLTATGTVNFGAADDFELPNSATPTVDTDGQVAIDTTVTDFSHGIMKYYSGEEAGVVAMPIAQFTSPTDAYVVSYNATNDEFELVAQSGGLSNIVEDTTPQLGGNLDVNGNQIVSVSAGDIELHSDNDVNIILGDAAGADDLNIKDSASAIVASINSDGAITAVSYGGITEANLVDKSATEVITGSWDFGGASTFEIPNAAAPTVIAAGQIAVDTTITDYTGLIKYHDGVEELTVVAMPTANLTTTDNHVVVYDAAGNEFKMEAQAAGGGGGAAVGQIIALNMIV